MSRSEPALEPDFVLRLTGLSTEAQVLNVVLYCWPDGTVTWTETAGGAGAPVPAAADPAKK